MYEENREFSWTNLFIKVIIALIIILFIVWIFSLYNNRKTSNVPGVITDSVFSENIGKMKNVGKEYFTSEKLPNDVGDIKIITLEEMYNKKLISTLKDKNGNACSAKNSYVSIQKIDDEYEMKTYLECGNVKDYSIVDIVCGDFCNSETCPKEEVPSESGNTQYEYAKYTGGVWSKWSDFSNWSTTKVLENDSRDVETKVVVEEYSYDKNGTKNEYVGKTTCPSVEGYTLASKTNGVCSYSKVTTTPKNPVCPSVSGYTYTGMNGFTCYYSKSTSDTTAPKCPSVSGYTYTGMNGFTCNYSKTTTDTTAPKCPSVSGYTYTGINGFTCNYSKTVTSTTEYTLSYYKTASGSYVPKDTATYHYVQKSADYVYNCDGSCGMKWYYTYAIYKKVYKTTTVTNTKTASCPSGYNKSGNTCAKSTTVTNTKTASCPSGYSKSGNTCAKSTTVTNTKTASCPSGYNKSGNTCVKNGVSTLTRDASCPSGYYPTGSTCAINSVSKTTRNAVCPSGQFIINGGCYKKVTTGDKETGTRNVTYYRYRTRSYIGGTVDYTWSNSQNDKNLLNDGYNLTGNTRNIETGVK